MKQFCSINFKLDSQRSSSFYCHCPHQPRFSLEEGGRAVVGTTGRALGVVGEPVEGGALREEWRVLGGQGGLPSHYTADELGEGHGGRPRGVL